ncbi:MAG: hypothetical protein R3E08_11400 [Thiotrichaceae bacterium]
MWQLEKVRSGTEVFVSLKQLLAPSDCPRVVGIHVMAGNAANHRQINKDIDITHNIEAGNRSSR